ncbi:MULTISPECIES: MBL fold metallo-hydrolase [unclassified Janibacter]|uniref:MBL fold metallo-hydrolase n=1 Tax=unclassified Janibacter TaxID=2649294 RepID=UPI003D0330B9
MLTLSFPAQALGTNCYVIAPAAGEECLVVDPGIGVESTLRDVLAEHRLRPAAVLLTHGHLDHTYSVTPVCGGDTAAYIHTDDVYRLTDPVGMISPQLLGMLEQQFGRRPTWTEPEKVVQITDRERLSLAGIDLEVLHAPGHTEGSVMFAIDRVPDGARSDLGLDRTLVTGDVLFQGSIGRTDLEGGDSAAMQRSLRDVVAPQPDSTLVLPGHGPVTTMAVERASNPYLQGL